MCLSLQGWGGLYKGIGPTIISGAPYTGLQMTSYELMKRASPGEGKSLFWQLLNGAMSGLFAQTRESAWWSRVPVSAAVSSPACRRRQ